MMKRIISFLLICSLLLIPNTYTKADDKVQSYGDFEYEISTNNNKEKEVVICGYTGTNENSKYSGNNSRRKGCRCI